MKKILFFLILFVNIHIGYNNGFCIYVGDQLFAQRMNRESPNSVGSTDNRSDSTFTCLYCEKSFDNEMDKVQHEYICSKNPCNIHRCPYCKQEFSTSDEANTHAADCKYNPTNPNQYFCSKCSKGFLTSAQKDEHERQCTYDPNERKYYCKKCHSSFTRQYELNNHMCKYKG